MERDLGAEGRRRTALRWAVFVWVAVLLAGQVGANADPAFDRAQAAADLAARLASSISALDPDAYVDSWVIDPDIRLWTNGDKHSGVDGVRESVAGLMAVRGGEAYVASSPRVLIEPSESWLLFDWTWGATEGTHIAKARLVDGGWRVVDADFDGATVGVDNVGFASDDAMTKVGGPLEALEAASAAFSAGEFDGRRLAEPFRFHDDEGQVFEDAEALLAAAFAPIPEGITEDGMTLLVSHKTRRALAYQDIAGIRVSLGLVREAGWLIAEASLSTRLEILSVSARGLFAATWAELRR